MVFLISDRTPIGLSALVFSLDVSFSGGVYPSGLSVLYGLWVKRVYTVTEGGFVGGNLQVFLSYDDIVGWCRNLVSPVVVRV